MNTTTGLATAFSLKTIVTAVVSLGVAAVVAVGGYSVATNYILFPEFGEALENTLEAKNEPLTEFDTQKFKEEGKTELSLDVPELDLDASLSLSHSEKALQAALKTCGETFTVSYKDLNLAVAADGFNDGKAYGLSLKNLRDEVMDSIFAADSGTDYEIDMDTINEVCDFVEKFTEPKEVSKEYERAYEYLMKVFEKSEMAKDAQVSYSKLEVLGEERSGRSQTLTINKDYVVKLLEDYVDAFDNAKGKDLDAIEYVLEDIATTTGTDEIEVDDVVEFLEGAIESIDEIEELEGIEIKYSVCYVGKYLSAIVASVEYKNKDIDANIKGTITVDFGEKPNKTKEIIFNVSFGGEVQEEKVEMFAEVVFDAKKEDGKVIYTVTLEAEADVPGDTYEINGAAEIVLNADKNKATAKVSGSFMGEEYDLVDAEFKLTDTKDQFSLTPKTLTVMDEEFEFPFDVTITMYRKPDKIKASKYENLLKMEEDEFDDLMDDLEDYVMDLAEDFADWGEALDGMDDLFDGFGGLIGGVEPDYSVIPNPGYEYEYGYGYEY